MTSTMTVDDLAKLVLGLHVAEAFDKVDLESVFLEDSTYIVTVDELAGQYLSSEAVQEFSNIELGDEHADCEIAVEQVEIGAFRLGKGLWRCTIQGKSLLFIVITIAALLIGTNAVIAILQALFGAS